MLTKPVAQISSMKIKDHYNKAKIKLESFLNLSFSDSDTNFGETISSSI